ncbi:major facilitator superfamily domain-containing protein [Mycotypha africana]|uniref:major facilitator superfamily domain-containing protein n=1 Tax=Mycotypha africana TaxID=64632 RepID=UPI002300F526|nr:major facilitator superfamily domain-containing protein [Mycotypha africana]KAI8992038.1 major facilitator superfamily domain-containing protein [Mycotypha africana]
MSSTTLSNEKYLDAHNNKSYPAELLDQSSVERRFTAKKATTEDNYSIHSKADQLSVTSTAIHREESRSKVFSKWWSKVMGDIYANDDPHSYSKLRKNLIIFIVALGGISGPIGSMIYMPGLVTVSRDLNTPMTAINGTVSAYVICMGIAPLFWASMSDAYGRKPMYIYSLIISVVAAILCAVSTNIGMLIVFRAVQACGSSSGQTLGAGVIADTIAPQDRGKAYGIFYIGPLLGPVIGPTIGGVLCQYLGWRSTFYFIAILSVVLLLLILFCLPETLRRKQVEIAPDEVGQVVVKKERFKALENLKAAFAPMLVMLGDPTVVVITIYNTIIFACLYFLTPTISETFEKLYGYTSTIVGLCYLVFGFGLMCGSVLSGRYSDFLVKKLREKKGPENIYPELRLRATFPAFVLIPIGYLIYAWTAEKGVGVYGPLIGLYIYALGQMCAFTPTSVYLVDSKPGRSASAVAINNCVRSIVGAISTIFSSSAVEAAGPGILYTILAAINVANCLTVVAVMIFGRKWRTDFEKRTGTGFESNINAEPTSKPESKERRSSAEYADELCIVHSRMSAV